VAAPHVSIGEKTRDYTVNQAIADRKNGEPILIFVLDTEVLRRRVEPGEFRIVQAFIPRDCG
jgi:hypothetical protein